MPVRHFLGALWRSLIDGENLLGGTEQCGESRLNGVRMNPPSFR